MSAHTSPLGRTSAPSAEAVLDRLDDAQRAAALAVSGPVLVLAGAGSGKTRAVTHRIAYGVLSGAWAPGHVLAVTFTRRAAGELRQRLDGLGVRGLRAATFHSAALAQMRYFWPRAAGNRPLPEIVDHKAPLVATAAQRLGRPADRAAVRDLAGSIEWAKSVQVAPDGYVAAAATAGRDDSWDATDVAEVYRGYEMLKEERHLADFEDVLLFTAGILESAPAVAAEFRDRYRTITVDEYQDTTPLQERLLRAWLGERNDVCVVGDPGQTIYSFAGASPELLLGFPRRHRGTTVVRLDRTYRCSPQVVSAANAVLHDGANRGPGASDAGRDRDAAGARRGWSVEAPPQVVLTSVSADGPPVAIRECPDPVAEAGEIARWLKDRLADGVPARECAVLVRVNAQMMEIESALAQAGVPHLVRGGTAFYDRMEVRRALVLLRGAAAAADPGVALPGLVRDALAGYWTPEAPAGAGAVRQEWESVAAIVRLADEATAADPEVTLAAFVADLRRRQDAQLAPAVDGVTVSTLHGAKGLEWDAVVVAGCSEGLLPFGQRPSEEQVAEERRLLYVGITRARRHVLLTWARGRTPGDDGRRRRSRFLDPIDRPAKATGTGRAARDKAAASSPAVEELSAEERVRFERLRAWRLARAQTDRVPAFVVFNDSVLAAIASTTPRTNAELLRIPGVGQTKLRKYGEDVLAALGSDGADGDSAD